MNAIHEFEDADTGDELTLNPNLTYEVVESFVELVDGGPVFTHRVRLKRLQFQANTADNTVEVIDLDDPWTPEDTP